MRGDFSLWYTTHVTDTRGTHIMVETATQNTNKPAQTIYTITFTGEYRCAAPLGQDVEHFEIDVQMLAEHVNYNPVSVFMHTGKEQMLAKYPNFLSFRKVKVANSYATTPQGTTRSALETGKLQLMNREDLTQFITQEGLAVDVSLYEANDAIIAAIKENQVDPDSFIKQQDLLRHRVKTPTFDLMESAKALNKPQQKPKPAQFQKKDVSTKGL
jgi:hypothetical protein